MPGLPELKRAPSPELAPDTIVTKLSQLVRFTEHVKIGKSTDGAKAIKEIAALTHSLVAEISDHLRLQERRIADLESLATTDALTRVLNRRGFEDCLAHELSVARRHGVGGVLIMVDLDEFEPINDVYGHVAGDEVLRAVSELLRGHIRDTDYIGRLGGDEFAVLLPRSNKRNGVRRAEDLDLKLNNVHAVWNKNQIPIKASCGAHMYSAKAELKELLEAADAAMYKIKQERREKYGLKAR